MRVKIGNFYIDMNRVIGAEALDGQQLQINLEHGVVYVLRTQYAINRFEELFFGDAYYPSRKEIANEGLAEVTVVNYP